MLFRMIFFAAFFFLFNQITPAAAPTDVRAYDTPNDNGRKINVEWKSSIDDINKAISGYEVYRSETVDGEYECRGYVGRRIVVYTEEAEN